MADLGLDASPFPVEIVYDTTGAELVIESDGSINAGNSDALNIENSLGFSVISEVLPISATETPVLLIKNPTGSGKKLRILNLILGLSASVGSATGNNDVFRLYVNPTITTNGTAVTITNMYSQASPPASVMTIFSSPTIAANGTKLAAYDVSSSGGSFLLPQGGTRVLDPNQNWLITQTGVVNGAATGLIQLEWIEE